jgi:alpha-D-ribose 1-methylphosphonate 5-triphosphate synthase subunit PhnL
VRHGTDVVDVAAAAPRMILELRRSTLGYVSQFLRVIPRVPTLDVVAEPLRARDVPAAPALARAMIILERLRIPERLWRLSPATFSGGEQQRVNVARAFVAPYPILLLDEPTASLDAESRHAVVGLIREAREAGAAILGTFHDAEVQDAVGTRVLRLHEERGA